MRVVLYRMDIYALGAKKFGWWKKDFEIKTLDDLENFMGYHCSDNQWGEIYEIQDDDDPEVIEHVKGFLDVYVTRTARETIGFLHEAVLKMLESEEERLATARAVVPK